MTFLRALRHPLSADFWTALARDHAGAPAALQELARGDSSVVCDLAEAEASLAWARAPAPRSNASHSRRMGASLRPWTTLRARNESWPASAGMPFPSGRSRI